MVILLASLISIKAEIDPLIIISTFPKTSIPNTEPSNNGNSTIIPSKSSSGGLSTGAICAIAIPCVALLLGAGIAAALLKGGVPAASAAFQPTLANPNYIDVSNIQINTPQAQATIPETVEPQPVQVQVVQPQPAPQLIRPQYPINQVQPPAVNNVFQPMFNQNPQMIKVERIEMVPVQKVEMVPVQEVVPIQQVSPVQNIQLAQNAQVIQAQPTVQVQTANQVGQINEITSSTKGFL